MDYEVLESLGSPRKLSKFGCLGGEVADLKMARPFVQEQLSTKNPQSWRRVVSGCV